MISVEVWSPDENRISLDRLGSLVGIWAAASPLGPSVIRLVFVSTLPTVRLEADMFGRFGKPDAAGGR
jgi:hypothetical protein